MTLAVGETHNQDSTCPYCHTVFDAVTGITEGAVRPDPGSFSICYNCAEIAVYDEHLVQQKPSEELLSSLPTDEFVELMDARRVLIATKEALKFAP